MEALKQEADHLKNDIRVSFHPPTLNTTHFISFLMLISYRFDTYFQ